MDRLMLPTSRHGTLTKVRNFDRYWKDIHLTPRDDYHSQQVSMDHISSYTSREGGCILTAHGDRISPSKHKLSSDRYERTDKYYR